MPAQQQAVIVTGKLIKTFTQMEKQDFRTIIQSEIRIDSNIIFCDYNGINHHQICTDDIVIISVHTNWNGPRFNFSYINFVTKDNQWQTLSLFAVNADKMIDYLQGIFQINFKKMLLTTLDKWNSIVVYPEHLQGNPFFKFIPTENYKEPKSRFDKVLAQFGIGNFNIVKYIDLTDEIRSEMTNASR